MGKKILLPLLASLGLAASVSVSAVVASVFQRDENSESVLNYNPKVRQYRFVSNLVSASSDLSDPFLAYFYNISIDDDDVYLDCVCRLTVSESLAYMDGYLFSVYKNEDSYLVLNFYGNQFLDDGYIFLNGYRFACTDCNNYHLYGLDGNEYDYYLYQFESSDSISNDVYNSLISSEVSLIWFVSDSNLDNYYASHQVVSGIEAGLPFVSNAAQALVGGFDSMALNNGALTNVMAFSFTLLGLGCAVGICKKVFSWITGRHGM